MTNSLQEQLDAMAGTDALRRGDARIPAIEDFEGLCTGYEYGRSGGEYDRPIIIFHHKDVLVMVNTGDPLVGNEYDLTINFPARPTTGSSYGRTMVAAEKNKLGTHPKEFVNKRIHWHGEVQTMKIREEESAFWVWTPSPAGADVGTQNGNAGQSAEPTEAAQEAALALLSDPMDIKAFNLSAVKNAVISKDNAMIAKIASGAWVDESVTSGLITREGDVIQKKG